MDAAEAGEQDAVQVGGGDFAPFPTAHRDRVYLDLVSEFPLGEMKFLHPYLLDSRRRVHL